MTAWLCNSWDGFWHCEYTSWGTHLLWTTLYSTLRRFTIKALAAVLHWGYNGKLHHGYFIWGYVVATLWLLYSYVMVLFLWLLHQPGEKCGYGYYENQQRITVTGYSYSSQVFFQPLNLSLAYLGFSELCEQQDNWHHRGSAIQKSNFRETSFKMPRLVKSD